jgi:hypothetical protein
MNADDLPLERRPALGSDCARPEYFAGARTSFTKFIAAERAVGGRPPIGTNGVPQMWNERRGWHDDTATDGRGATSARRLSMLEILTR